ncbi:hypothetical protein Tco_1157157 [Tanacetum coccineum]
MLKTVEKNVSSKSVISSLPTIRDRGVKNKSWKMGKGKSKERKKVPPPPKKESVAKDAECFNYRMIGNWKRNYPSHIGSYFLNVPSGMELRLEQCHYSYSITRGVIFVPRLKDAGFKLASMHYDMDGVISIDKFLFHVAKRTKYDLNRTYLWHCRPDHINKRHIKKLQSEGYALETTSHILNKVPTKKVEKTPYKLWHGKVPKLSFIRVWGFDVLVKHSTPNKLETRDIKFKFVGYPKETARYYFYYPEENIVFFDRNGQFLKSDYLLQEFSGSDEILDEIQDTPTKLQNEEPSLSSIILRDSELVVEEPNPINLVVQDPTKNQENDVTPAAPVLQRYDRPSHPPEKYYGYLKSS